MWKFSTSSFLLGVAATFLIVLLFKAFQDTGPTKKYWKRSVGSNGLDAATRTVTNFTNDGTGRLKELVDLAKKYRPDDWGDKTYTGYRWQYFEAYVDHFHHLRKISMTVLHLGVSNGASLLMFQDYMPKATHVGLDLNKKPEHAPLLKRGIHIVYGDARDAATLRKIGEAYGNLYLVIDDLYHDPDQILSSMNVLAPFLKQGGYYVVEDTEGFQLNCTRWHEFVNDIVAQINNVRLKGCYKNVASTGFTDAFSLHMVPNMVMVQKKRHMRRKIDDPDKLNMTFDEDVPWY